MLVLGIWAVAGWLGGQMQPYIDGRMLDTSRLPPYTHILWATPQGVQLFDRGNFLLVILPRHGRFDPQRYKLIERLAARHDCRLAYRDNSWGCVYAAEK